MSQAKACDKSTQARFLDDMNSELSKSHCGNLDIQKVLTIISEVKILDNSSCSSHSISIRANVDENGFMLDIVIIQRRF